MLLRERHVANTREGAVVTVCVGAAAENVL